MVAIPVQQRRRREISERRAGTMTRNKSKVHLRAKLTQCAKRLTPSRATSEGSKGGHIPAEALSPSEHQYAAETTFLRRRLPDPADRPHLGTHTSTQGLEQAPKGTLRLKLKHPLHGHADLQSRWYPTEPWGRGKHRNVKALRLSVAMGKATLAHAPGQGAVAVGRKTLEGKAQDLPWDTGAGGGGREGENCL